MSLPRNTKQDVKVDIKEGDTIWDLSQKLGVDVGAASGYKSGDPNLIYVGRYEQPGAFRTGYVEGER